MHALDSFFAPKGVAVVGASRDPRKLGYIILDNLLRGGFRGQIYPVNLAGGSILGLTAYPRLTAIDGEIDLAVVVVPAEAVAGVIDDCASAGVAGAVIISAGFRERGGQGAARERDLVKRAKAGGLRIIGPNSVGIINTAACLNATFAAGQPRRYPVALVSQSGAVATAILDWGRAIGVGFSKFVSLGNMADVTEVELLDYLECDRDTNLVVVYLEGMSDGRRFLEVARRVTRTKPVIAMKVGRSSAGARAASSHTGAMASSDAVVDAAFRQAGVVRAYNMEELFDLTLAFSYSPPSRGPRVAVVTNAGGPGVMATDAIERNGLQLARLSDATRGALTASLPAAASVANPVDLLGDARSSRYARAIDLVANDEGVDAIAVLLTPQAMTDAEQTAREIAHLARACDKPVIAAFMGGDAVAVGRSLLDGAHVPVFGYPERAIRAISALDRYRRYRDSVGTG
jgi:acetyl coenzyme A synthetase (ADP forming)-like protein